ncbi:hypothetical protein OG607_03405 [Streptomyces sp. NBC_01537]|uniref:hypothetical protein n=1 Tax=Streptomyces sp. NBC_01537 TaxID=2903896 RepID=UPI00386D207E
MTRVGISGSHRSKKKRITLMLAPVAALAVAIPLMAQAGAATPSEVAADCQSDPATLEKCEFVDVQFKRNSLGPNERVSAISDNCGIDSTATKTFSVTASVSRQIQIETGRVIDGGITLGNSVFEVGGKFTDQTFNLTSDTKTSTLSFSRTDTVLANNTAFFMWSAKRTDVSGFLKATYKEAQDGRTVFFSPAEGAATVHVFYPQLLKDGTPDGRLWLRNVQCSATTSTTSDDGNVASLRDADSGAEQAGFGEGGSGVTDVEIPLSEVTPG